MTTVTDELAALLDTDIDRTRDVWRDGMAVVRGSHVHFCWTPRDDALIDTKHHQGGK